MNSAYPGAEITLGRPLKRGYSASRTHVTAPDPGTQGICRNRTRFSECDNGDEHGCGASPDYDPRDGALRPSMSSLQLLFGNRAMPCARLPCRRVVRKPVVVHPPKIVQAFASPSMRWPIVPARHDVHCGERQFGPHDEIGGPISNLGRFRSLHGSTRRRASHVAP